MESPAVCVILPAAGIGSRMNMDMEKQFALVLNRPIISYTMSAFEEIHEVMMIVVVVQPDKFEEMRSIIKKFNHKRVTIALGSSSRHKSILEGLMSLKKTFSTMKLDVIVIHDGVRPYVESQDILSVIHAASKYGAAGMVRPLASTPLKVGHKGFMEHTLKRDEHRASEMPQACLYQLMCDAYEKCSEYELEHGTECLHLLQKYTGTNVKLIDGPEHLWKITYKKDLENFEEMVRGNEWKCGVVLFHGSSDNYLADRFQQSLLLVAKDISLVSHDCLKVDELPIEAGTFLFLVTTNHEMITGSLVTSGCQCKCYEQLHSSCDQGDNLRICLLNVSNIIHYITFKKMNFIHKRMCIMFVVPKQDFTPMVHATRRFNHCFQQTHFNDCNVTVNAAIFMDGKDVSPCDISSFIKDLHFMNPGRAYIY